MQAQLSLHESLINGAETLKLSSFCPYCFTQRHFYFPLVYLNTSYEMAGHTVYFYLYVNENDLNSTAPKVIFF